MSQVMREVIDQHSEEWIITNSAALRLESIQREMDHMDEQLKIISRDREILLEEKTTIINELKMLLKRTIRNERKPKPTGMSRNKDKEANDGNGSDDSSDTGSDLSFDTDEDLDDDEDEEDDDYNDLVLNKAQNTGSIANAVQAMELEAAAIENGQATEFGSDQYYLNQNYGIKSETIEDGIGGSAIGATSHSMFVNQQLNQPNSLAIRKNRHEPKSRELIEYCKFIERTRDFLENFQGVKSYPQPLKTQLLQFAKLYGMKKVARESGVSYANLKTWKRKHLLNLI